MVDQNLEDFRKRLKQVDKTINKGKQTVFDYQTATFEPVKRRSVLRWIPWRYALYTVGLITIMKVLLLADLGEGRYRAHLANAQDGSIASKVGVFVMDLDPVTMMLRDQLDPVFRSAGLF